LTREEIVATIQEIQEVDVPKPEIPDNSVFALSTPNYTLESLQNYK
jgi:hypothetical protein